MSLWGRVRARLGGGRAETRKAGGSFASFGYPGLAGAGTYNAALAENLATVTACVEVIAGTISTLPAYVFRQIAHGRAEAPDHPVSALIRRPNPRQTWPDWLAMQMAQVLLHGNALSIIERDADGRPVELVPVPWLNVTVSVTSQGRLAFDVLRMTPGGSAGQSQRFFEDEVFLLKGRSDDGYLGRSVLSRAPSVIAAALGAQTFAQALWEGGANPSMALNHPGKLNSDAKAYLREEIERMHTGARNAGRIMVLDESMQVTPLSLSAEDAELIASRRFGGEELARLFNVPAPLVGDLTHGSYSNVETMGRYLAQFCLSPWARRIEAEFSRSVFLPDEPHHLMIDLAGLQRGDEAGRWATYGIAIDKGILGVNEVRGLEGWNPLPESAPDSAPEAVQDAAAGGTA